MLVTYIAAKGLLPTIFKELIQVNKQNMNSVAQKPSIGKGN